MAKKEDKKPTSLKDINPFKLQSTLVKQAGLTSKYTGGDMSTTVEWNVDKMLDPMKQALEDDMNKKESSSGTGSDGSGGSGGSGDTNVDIGDININTDGSKTDTKTKEEDEEET